MKFRNGDRVRFSANINLALFDLVFRCGMSGNVVDDVIDCREIFLIEVDCPPDNLICLKQIWVTKDEIVKISPLELLAEVAEES